MFSDLVVLYLFLGGAGAGAIAVCCVLDLTLVRQPFSLRASYAPGSGARAADRMLDLALLSGFVMLAFSVVCLMADLGRLDRMVSLFFSSRLTPLTVGAFSLAVLLVLDAALVAVRFLYLPGIPQVAVRIAEGVAAVVALVVMTYTGVLLQGLTGVAFWQTPLLPVLFAFSSLSCGAAVLFVVAPFAGVFDLAQRRALEKLARFDIVLIALEVLVAAGMLWWAHGSANPAVQASLEALSTGSAAVSWWLGFVVCGLAVPLCAEVTLAARGRACPGSGSGSGPGSGVPGQRKALAVAAAFVLVGALCMRWSIVQAGQHRDLELQPQAQEQVLSGGQVNSI